MAIEVLREEGDVPASYPNVTLPMSPAALMLAPGMIWSRIEAWCSHRWTPREVVWIVEGSGSFTPRLKPADLTKAEYWADDWTEFTPAQGPLGLLFSGGMYRLTYNVGNVTSGAPEAVQAAFKRYAEYVAEMPAEAGATSITDGDYSVTRPASSLAKALQYSGAADLLRAYR